MDTFSDLIIMYTYMCKMPPSIKIACKNLILCCVFFHVSICYTKFVEISSLRLK